MPEHVERPRDRHRWHDHGNGHLWQCPVRAGSPAVCAWSDHNGNWTDDGFDSSSATGCPILPCGTYSLSGFVAGSYTRSASKVGGIPVATITSFDSARIAQHVVGLMPFTEPTQSTVADVSGTGGVTSFDAALIARYVVSLPAPVHPELDIRTDELRTVNRLRKHLGRELCRTPDG